MITLGVFLLSTATHSAMTPDWSENAEIPAGKNRANIYGLSQKELDVYVRNGQFHSMVYPVTVTGLLIPYRPFLKALAPGNPVKDLILKLSKKMNGYSTEKEFYEWLGLSPFNTPYATGIFHTPVPANATVQKYLGAGIIKTKDGEGLTFSCYACHATNLFGTTVMGLTNKQPHSNKLFHEARSIMPNIPNLLFKIGTGATEGEVRMFERSKNNITSVYSVVPQVHGLDTSLPHTALSLARRNNDAYATKNKSLERYPRQNELMHYVADSKPMPWWNIKYKTRWLSDGSVVSGNPIFTNILWNELGRGTDLKELEVWMKKNSKVVAELTAAAFNNEAPRYNNFFNGSTIDLVSAKRGEKLFNSNCMSCHGQYEKAWSRPGAAKISHNIQMETTKVIYHEQTPVFDVGTDPQRYISMRYFADALNDLAISKWMGTVVEPQEGYVPPPLVGIWARYPYFHNNSVPTLCEVLELPKNRTKIFYLGPAENRETDFDQECVGYPVGNKIPKKWIANTESRYDTSKAGLRNIGHDKMLIDRKTGREKFTRQDKRDIVNFLKTL